MGRECDYNLASGFAANVQALERIIERVPLAKVRHGRSRRLRLGPATKRAPMSTRPLSGHAEDALFG